MKKAHSNLIDAFLANAERGLITGKDNSSGPVILANMVEALTAIRDGLDPDEALAITRKPGGPADDTNFALAVLIHLRREQGKTWEALAGDADRFLADQGREPVSVQRLQAIYKQHRKRVELAASIHRMALLTEKYK